MRTCPRSVLVSGSSVVRRGPDTEDTYTENQLGPWTSSDRSSREGLPLSSQGPSEGSFIGTGSKVVSAPVGASRERVETLHLMSIKNS